VAAERITIVLDHTAIDNAPRVPSSEFRTSYTRLDEIHVVTALDRDIAIYVPLGPAPRSAQHVEQTGDGDRGAFSRGAGRSEAPDDGLADTGASTTSRPAGHTATGRGAGRRRTPKPSAATLLDRANRAGRSR
jgi:hypothetical protein